MDARDFAIQAHGDQKYGDEPYVTHLDQVWAVLQEYGFTETCVRNGAFLHDVLEDCPNVSREDIKAKFGNATVYIVDFCTDEPGHNRKERKAATYKRVRATIDLYPIQDNFFGIYAIRVKVADRLSNLRSCHAVNPGLLPMYRKEREAFKTALYAPGVCDAMWAEYDALLGA